MANVAEIDSTFDRLGDDPPLAPEVVGEPYPGLTEAEDADETVPGHGTLKQEEVVDASKGRKDEKSRKGDSLDRVNVALLLSVTAVTVIGTIVAIARKLRER